MARLDDSWEVPPHGALVAVADGILTVEGAISMPLGNFPRRMTVVAPKGIGAWIMARLFGFGVDRPRTARPARRMFVRDAAALAAQFRAWAALPDLGRIIVSHGDVIDRAPGAPLEQAASDFG